MPLGQRFMNGRIALRGPAAGRWTTALLAAAAGCLFGAGEMALGAPPTGASSPNASMETSTRALRSARTVWAAAMARRGSQGDAAF